MGDLDTAIGLLYQLGEGLLSWVNGNRESGIGSRESGIGNKSFLKP
ncbi:AraC family transcriptional regulator [Moorena producens]